MVTVFPTNAPLRAPTTNRRAEKARIILPSTAAQSEAKGGCENLSIDVLLIEANEIVSSRQATTHVSLSPQICL